MLQGCMYATCIAEDYLCVRVYTHMYMVYMAHAPPANCVKAPNAQIPNNKLYIEGSCQQVVHARMYVCIWLVHTSH